MPATASTVMRGRPIAMEIDGTMVCITKWGIDEKANSEVVTNSCSPGDGPEKQQGSPEDTVTWEGFVKSDQNIADASGINLNRGTYHTVKLLYRKTNPIFKQADIFIESMKTDADINGHITFSGTATVSGDVQQPIY